jgi:hypothetical protein
MVTVETVLSMLDLLTAMVLRLLLIPTIDLLLPELFSMDLYRLQELTILETEMIEADLRTATEGDMLLILLVVEETEETASETEIWTKEEDPEALTEIVHRGKFSIFDLFAEAPLTQTIVHTEWNVDVRSLLVEATGMATDLLLQMATTTRDLPLPRMAMEGQFLLLMAGILLLPTITTVADKKSRRSTLQNYDYTPSRRNRTYTLSLSLPLLSNIFSRVHSHFSA